MRCRVPSRAAAAATVTVLAAVAAGLPVAGAAPHAAVAAAGSRPLGGDRLGSTAVVVAAGAPALPAGVTASSWLIANADTGEVLAARNPHGRFAPASTLKILTALTLLPRLDPRRIMTVTNADETVDGTKVGLVPGLRIRIDQLFTALLVVSANDAANVLARAAGGQGTVIRGMSSEARQLQALDTVPKTVHGLDASGQTSSAYDLALLGRAGMALPAFRRYVAIRRARIPAPGGKSFEIDTHDRLLGHYPGEIGIKNGHTDAAGSSLVAEARRGDRSVLVTLMHADSGMWRPAAAMLNWGFSAEGRAMPVGTLVPPVPAAAAPGATATSPAPGGGGLLRRTQRQSPSQVRAELAIGGLLATLLVGVEVLRRRLRA
jgi:serine-type D-Ala-D-Ala carboxypeptidase (penicillin-binding protein 5/6)